MIGRVHEGAQIVPEKNRGSSPLSKEIFLVLVTDDSVGKVMGRVLRNHSRQQEVLSMTFLYEAFPAENQSQKHVLEAVAAGFFDRQGT